MVPQNQTSEKDEKWLSLVFVLTPSIILLHESKASIAFFSKEQSLSSGFEWQYCICQHWPLSNLVLSTGCIFYMCMFVTNHGRIPANKKICITFVQCWTNGKVAGPTFYKCQSHKCPIGKCVSATLWGGRYTFLFSRGHVIICIHICQFRYMRNTWNLKELKYFYINQETKVKLS